MELLIRVMAHLTISLVFILAMTNMRTITIIMTTTMKVDLLKMNQQNMNLATKWMRNIQICRLVMKKCEMETIPPGNITYCFQMVVSMKQIIRDTDLKLLTKEETSIPTTMNIPMNMRRNMDMVGTQRKLLTISSVILGNHITILSIMVLRMDPTSMIRMDMIMDIVEQIMEFTTATEDMIAMHMSIMETSMVMGTAIADTIKIQHQMVITIITITGIMVIIVEEAITMIAIIAY
uniref:Uncharacterized protein n=1 Tax=Anopheles quadriannulatus TaxID=34691 RepID=A0A182XPD8_ANOQN